MYGTGSSDKQTNVWCRASRLVAIFNSSRIVCALFLLILLGILCCTATDTRYKSTFTHATVKVLQH